MLRRNRQTALRHETSAAERIPYGAHVAPQVVRTSAGDFLQIMRLGGASFESADDEQLNTWHERLNVLWRNIASPQIALWTHVIRRRENIAAPATDTLHFAERLQSRYARRLATETLMVNEIFVAAVYRPIASVATGIVSRMFAKTQRDALKLELAEALEACQKLRQTMCAAFPVLGARTDGDQTVLTGTLADQAALYGVLAEIEALGLELLEVRRMPPR